jgi:hypothetical protein
MPEALSAEAPIRLTVRHREDIRLTQPSVPLGVLNDPEEPGYVPESERAYQVFEARTERSFADNHPLELRDAPTHLRKSARQDVVPLVCVFELRNRQGGRAHGLGRV